MKLNIPAIEAILVQELKKFPEITLAILFGSCAQNKATKKSDIDLAILASKLTLPVEKIMKIENHLHSVLKRKIDLIQLRSVSGLILREILTQGKILFNQDPDEYAKIMKRMLLDSSDFLPLWKKLVKTRREKFFNE